MGTVGGYHVERRVAALHPGLTNKILWRRPIPQMGNKFRAIWRGFGNGFADGRVQRDGRSPWKRYRRSSSRIYGSVFRTLFRNMLPPGVVPDSDPPICQLCVCDYPSTTFGPYLEAFIMVRVKVDDVRYWYQPVIFTDREPALAAGREIWGFAKNPPPVHTVALSIFQSAALASI